LTGVAEKLFLFNFFPTWLFGSNEPGLRVQALTAIALWIAVNSFGLWFWLRLGVISSSLEWQAPAP